MAQEPYRSARRVFWVVDNGSSPPGRGGGRAAPGGATRDLVLVHLPIHASWLNQVEIYFCVVQRKVLTPPDAPSLEVLAARILAFQARYERPRPPVRVAVHPGRPWRDSWSDSRPRDRETLTVAA